MHDIDVALKLLLQGTARLAMQDLMGVAVEKWHNVELPEIQKTRVDLLGETSNGELIHIEVQSRNERLMPLRMAQYCLRIFRRFDRFPRQIVLYVGYRRPRIKTALARPFQSFRFELVDIRDWDSQRLLSIFQSKNDTEIDFRSNAR